MRYLKLILFIFLALFLYSDNSYAIDVTNCTVITSPGYYVVQNDLYLSWATYYANFGVTSCIAIDSDDVYLDFNGFGFVTDVKNIGIYSISHRNITITNLNTNMSQGSATAPYALIEFDSSEVIIKNSNFNYVGTNSVDRFLYIDGATSNITIDSVKFTSNTYLTEGVLAYGIYNTTLLNINSGNLKLRFYTSNVYGKNVYSQDAGFDQYGFGEIYDSTFTTLRVSGVTSNAGTLALINTTFNSLTWDSGGSGLLAYVNTYWYVDVYVQDSLGNPVSGAYVEIVNGTQSYSETTDATGHTGIFVPYVLSKKYEVTVGTGITNVVDYNPYTLRVSYPPAVSEQQISVYSNILPYTVTIGDGISDCVDITYAGDYNIISDLNGNEKACIRILSDNVTLDCQNHLIYNATIGISIPNNNVTVRNCNLDIVDLSTIDYTSRGVSISGDNVELYNFNITSSDTGAYLYNAYDVSFYNMNLTSLYYLNTTLKAYDSSFNFIELIATGGSELYQYSELRFFNSKITTLYSRCSTMALLFNTSLSSGSIARYSLCYNYPGHIYQYWWVYGRVKYPDDTPVFNATVTAYDVNGVKRFEEYTNSSGELDKSILLFREFRAGGESPCFVVRETKVIDYIPYKFDIRKSPDYYSFYEGVTDTSCSIGYCNIIANCPPDLQNHEVILDTTIYPPTPPVINSVNVSKYFDGQVVLYVNATDINGPADRDTSWFNDAQGSNTKISSNDDLFYIDILDDSYYDTYLFINDSYGYVDSFRVNVGWTDNFYEEDTTFNNNLSTQRVVKQDYITNYQSTDSLLYYLEYIGLSTGTLLEGLKFSNIIAISSTDSLLTKYEGDWLNESSTSRQQDTSLQSVVDENAYSYVLLNVTNNLNVNFTNIYLSICPINFTANPTTTQIPSDGITDFKVTCYANVIKSNLSSVVIFSPDIYVDSEVDVNLYYDVFNEDNISYTSVRFDAKLPQYFYNTSSATFYLDLLPNDLTTVTVSARGTPVYELNNSLSSAYVVVDNSSYLNYSYRATLNVSMEEASTKNIIYTIPKTRLSNFDSRNQTFDKVYVDGISDNLIVTETTDSLIINITNYFGNSSLHYGLHTVLVNYLSPYSGVPPSEGGGGGGGGGGLELEPVGSLKISPQSLIFAIPPTGGCDSQQLTITWISDIEATISIDGSAIRDFFTPVDSFPLAPNTYQTITIKLCSPEDFINYPDRVDSYIYVTADSYYGYVSEKVPVTIYKGQKPPEEKKEGEEGGEGGTEISIPIPKDVQTAVLVLLILIPLLYTLNAKFI